MSGPKDVRGCSVCGTPVTRRRKNGQQARTCSVECEVAALDKLIDALLERRHALLEALGW